MREGAESVFSFKVAEAIQPYNHDVSIAFWHETM